VADERATAGAQQICEEGTRSEDRRKLMRSVVARVGRRTEVPAFKISGDLAEETADP